MTKTIQELQQETAEKFDEQKFVIDPEGVMIDDEEELIKKFVASSQQSAYDLGCEVTMERVRVKLDLITVTTGLV